MVKGIYHETDCHVGIAELSVAGWRYKISQQVYYCQEILQHIVPGLRVGAQYSTQELVPQVPICRFRVL